MTDAAGIVVIGDALIDELRDDSGVREFVGGAALNVAVGIARLGLPATLIAMVGDDEAGERIRRYLADFRVELIATPSPHGTARAVSTRSAGGEPVYVFNTAARERRIRYAEAERAAIAASAMTVVSCVAFDDAEQTAELVDAVRGRAGALAIDPNPREGMLRDRAAFVEGFETAAALADLVKVGDDDAALLYGTGLDELGARLRGRGVRSVLLTRGRDGAGVRADGVVIDRAVAELPGPIVDTMGAGDAVLASAVAAASAAWPGDEAAWGSLLEQAMTVAAATCRHEGALLRLPSAVAGSGS